MTKAEEKCYKKGFIRDNGEDENNISFVAPIFRL
jgi:hypothetical protein